ncbi:sensor domain-containing diguanylate cyclase [Thiomicrorhabdus indica]|uniref:sensor domain-containing diguanylate cyclase n=1 Tax=Thiomicrorhabdus indica TaxID=2267253 RepID=UPI00102DE730|nr:diguanylate cyclase [Thiomicrorhabdus indica]
MESQNEVLIEALQQKISDLQRENSELKQHQIDIQKAKELYIGILEDFPALIWRANTDKLCDYFNSTWLAFTGRTMEQEYGFGWLEGVHPDDLDRCIEIYTTHFDKRKSFSMEYRLKNHSGEYRWILDIGRPYYDLDETFLGYIGSCYDVTDQKQNEKRLEMLATTDTLTQLNNRFQLDNILDAEIARANRYQNELSIILCDIDNFKSVNDSYGHIIGDEVIVHIATMLKNNTRLFDTVGRWGGEEFLIICPETDSASAGQIAEKLRKLIEQSPPKNTEIKTCSFGVTSLNKNDTPIKLLQRVDQALYLAKNNGKNQTNVI